MHKSKLSSSSRVALPLSFNVYKYFLQLELCQPRCLWNCGSAESKAFTINKEVLGTTGLMPVSTSVIKLRSSLAWLS